MDKFSQEIWEQNYRAPGEKTIDDTWKRIARACAAVEPTVELQFRYKTEFYELLKDFKFIPGGRIMANIGLTSHDKTTLYNCYVNTIQGNDIYDCDSLNGIYDYLKKQALTLQSEGGLGINMDWMRPAGSYVNGIGSRSPGVCKFLELWDKSSEIITSGSEKIIGSRHKDEKKKVRKGAQICTLSSWHPDIEEFVTAKQTSGRLTKFNLSIGVTGEFMHAVKENKNYDLIFPDTSYSQYKHEWDGNIEKWKAKGFPIIVCKTIKARELWDLIMRSTFEHNEPGILFLDNINKLNPLSYAENIVCANPCAEIPMAGPSVCLLGSLNLAKFVSNNEFDFVQFGEAIHTAIRFLDNVNDISETPLQEYKYNNQQKRRIGLGTLGLGSLHFILNIPYGSKKSLELVEKIYQTKCINELQASSDLGFERGSFPLFDKDKYFNTEWWNTLPIPEGVKDFIKSKGTMRNSHRSMNAPTGNTSTMAEYVSGGIEPVFLKQYIRWSIIPESEYSDLKKQGFEFPNMLKGEWFETKHLKFTKKGKDTILKGEFNGSEYEVDRNRGLIKSTLIEDYGYTVAKALYPDDNLKDTASLSVEDHLGPLRIIAKYTDLNSSKTINIPNTYEYKDFKNLYMHAWEYGIKGITTYRAGTMTAVLEEKQETAEFQNDLERQFEEAGENIIPNVLKLPKECYSKMFIVKDNNKKKWYVSIVFADKTYKRPFGIFVNTNCHESDEITDAFITAMENLILAKGIDIQLLGEQRQKYAHQKNVVKIARITGMALRHNLKITDIVDVMEKCTDKISSLVYHLCKVLSKYIPEGTKVQNETCPSCGHKKIIYKEGCKSCLNCSWGKC